MSNLFLNVGLVSSTAVYTLTLSTYRVVNSLVEVTLFIWFLQSLLKRPVQPLLDDA